MKIIHIPVGINPGYPTNCWLAVNEKENSLLIVDPGFFPELIIKEIEKTGAEPKGILLTHGHYDHMMACPRLRDHYSIPVYAAKADLPFLQNSVWNQSETTMKEPLRLMPQVLLEDGQTFSLAGFDITFIHTPGHTYGSGCYYLPGHKTLFSGDTIFYNRHGKTIWPTGSAADMMHSLIFKLMVLPEDTQVLCGHEGNTTIKDVKPYFSAEYRVLL